MLGLLNVTAHCQNFLTKETLTIKMSKRILDQVEKKERKKKNRKNNFQLFNLKNDMYTLCFVNNNNNVPVQHNCATVKKSNKKTIVRHTNYV